jgi:hypothetical protein
MTALQGGMQNNVQKWKQNMPHKIIRPIQIVNPF